MPHPATAFCALVLLSLVGSVASAAAAPTRVALTDDWKPIDPAHLALKAPQVEPGADAEALFWEVRVSDDADARGDVATTFHHYLRVKVFTDRGREMLATVDLSYSSGVDVKDVAARTIRADGSIVELKKSDIYRRTVVKASDLKVRAVSFAVPAIDRGVIIEYRWREVHRDTVAANLRLPFSRQIPIHVVRYYVRPLSVPGYSMIAWPFNGKFTPPEKQHDGHTIFGLTNVAADTSEEYAIPPFEQRPWMFISYEPRGRSRFASEFWKDFGRELHEEFSKRSKPDGRIRALATKAIAGATTDAEKLAALVRAARAGIRRVDVDTADREDLRKARETRNASDALARGIGTADDVVLLVLALANAAGLDARVAATSSRADLFQRSVQPHPYFVRGRIVAVRSGEGWLFADPVNEYAERGQLSWEYEDQRVLVANRGEALFVQTPPSPAAYSVKRRMGTFRLLEDGTLEGEARLEYTGHWADIFREQEDQDTSTEREKDLKDLVSGRLPGAEITDLRVDHVTDVSGPYTNAYRIRAPGFAQRSGSRLFLQPSVFQKGVEALFKSAERKGGVYFPFAWREEDVITIELPAAFALAERTAPKPMDVGAASYASSLEVSDGARLAFRRSVVVGQQGIYFDVAVYHALRAFFDAVHRADAHTLILRRKEGSQ